MPYKDPEKRRACGREKSRRYYQKRKAQREAARREAAEARRRSLFASAPSDPVALEEALAELYDRPLTPLETGFLRELIETHGLADSWRVLRQAFETEGRVTLLQIKAALETPS